MKTRLWVAGALLTALAVGGASEARAGKITMARELAEYALKKWGLKAASEGAEVLTRRIASAASRHGDDVFAAVRKAGPKALSIADDAGQNAPRALRLLARHGDEAVALLNKRSLKLLSISEGAGEVLLKHPGAAEGLLERYGAQAVSAMAAVGPRGGRQLAMVEKSLSATGQMPQMMDIVARFGDKAATFIWEKKGALAVSATLGAFIANPEPFIDGTRSLAETVVKDAVAPISGHLVDAGAQVADSALAHAVKPVASELARAAAAGIPWGTASVLVILIAGGVGGSLVLSRRHRRTSAAK
jgi:hypothetical protein